MVQGYLGIKPSKEEPPSEPETGTQLEGPSPFSVFVDNLNRQ